MFDPYQILGVDRTANEAAIKKAHKAKALALHPDRNGGQESDEFTNCTRAKDILLDPELRKAYNAGGWRMLERVEEHRKALAHERVQKCAPLVIQYEVTLEQVYRGETVTVTCEVPHEAGTGTEVEYKPWSIPIKLRGELLQHAAVVPDQGRSKADCRPGDIVIEFSLKETDFEVQGPHLIYNVALSLGSLVAGYQFNIAHPDGKTYHIEGRYNSGDDVIVYPELGLPRQSRGAGACGDLLVKFSLDLGPIELAKPEMIKALTALLNRDEKLRAQTAPIDGTVDVTKRGVSLEEMQARQQAAMSNMPNMSMLINEMSGDPGAGCPVQ